MCRRLLGSKPAILFSTKLRSTRGVRRVSVRSSKFFSRLLKLSELLGYPVDQCSSLLAPTTLEPRVATSTSCKMLQVANGTAGLRQKTTFIYIHLTYLCLYLCTSLSFFPANLDSLGPTGLLPTMSFQAPEVPHPQPEINGDHCCDLPSSRRIGLRTPLVTEGETGQTKLRNPYLLDWFPGKSTLKS